MYKTHNVMSDPDDLILTENVESLMSKQNLPTGMTTPQYLYVQEVTRENFYQRAIPKVPRVVQYIFESDLDADERAKGLNFGLRNLLVFDGNFLTSLMTYLGQPNVSPNGVAAVGAYMVRIISEYAEAHPVVEDTKGKKSDKDKKEDVKPDAEAEGIERLNKTVGTLLKNVVEKVDVKCPGMNERAGLAVAAALAMANEHTIPALISYDLPITANLIDIIRESGNNQAMNVIIASAFLLEKSEYPKFTENQEKFIDSLAAYVFRLINEKNEMEIYALLSWVYGVTDGRNVKLENYVIDPRSCGTQHGRLHATVKHMFPTKK